MTRLELAAVLDHARQHVARVFRPFGRDPIFDRVAYHKCYGCTFWPQLILFIAIALTAGCAGSGQTERSRSDAGQPTRSLNSDSPALITFVNRSEQSVNVYWIDFGGNRQLYKTLEAGASFTQQTFLTHPWLVTDANGRPWNVYLPEAQPRTVYLQAPSAGVIAR